VSEPACSRQSELGTRVIDKLVAESETAVTAPLNEYIVNNVWRLVADKARKTLNIRSARNRNINLRTTESESCDGVTGDFPEPVVWDAS
jgi:hypothetical protein